MRPYHGPRDYLDAASSAATPPDELAALASSDYSFVRLAVASNPATPAEALSRLLPSAPLPSPDQDIAAALARRQDVPPDLLSSLARLLPSYLDCGRANHDAFGVAVSLCCNPVTRREDVRRLLEPERSKPQFRNVVARECRDVGILELLSLDPSSTVRARAKARLQALRADPRQ